MIEGKKTHESMILIKWFGFTESNIFFVYIYDILLGRKIYICTKTMKTRFKGTDGSWEWDAVVAQP